MNLDFSRRVFLTAVAAGVTAALAPALTGRTAARLPGDLAYASITNDTTNMAVRMNGAITMYQQMMHDYSEAEQIAARVAAIDVILKTDEKGE